MKIVFVICLLITVCFVYGQNQKDVIVGNVKDVFGEALPGAIVTIECNDTVYGGVISDFQGRYSISIPDSLQKFKVIFSFIGFKEKSVVIIREEKKRKERNENPKKF